MILMSGWKHFSIYAKRAGADGRLLRAFAGGIQTTHGVNPGIGLFSGFALTVIYSTASLAVTTSIFVILMIEVPVAEASVAGACVDPGEEAFDLLVLAEGQGLLDEAEDIL